MIVTLILSITRLKNLAQGRLQEKKDG